MKNGIILTSLLILSLSGSNSLASEGGHVGGGGGFVCEGGKIFTLDTIEGARRGFHLNLVGSNFREKITFALNRLKELDVIDGTALYETAMNYANDIASLEESGERYGNYVMFSDEPLKITDDSLETFEVPRQCSRKIQIARQHAPEVEEDRLIEIDLNAWRSMDSTERATIVLHEAVYTWMIASYGDTNSKRTRYAVQLYTDQKFQQQSQCDYINAVSEKLSYLLFAPEYAHRPVNFFYTQTPVVARIRNQSGTIADLPRCDPEGRINFVPEGGLKIKFEMSVFESTEINSQGLIFRDIEISGERILKATLNTPTTGYYANEIFSKQTWEPLPRQYRTWISFTSVQLLPQMVDFSKHDSLKTITRKWYATGDLQKKVTVREEFGSARVLSIDKP